MDTTLVTVTVLSMSMAAALSAIVWRLLRDERRRSEARVAALSDAARVARRPAAPSRAAAPAQGGDDLLLRPSALGAPALFEPPTRSSPWGHRVAIMAAIALVGAAAALFALAGRTKAAPTIAVDRPSDLSSPRLELLSLRDTRQDGSLTITGLVQNPRAGALLTRVAVTAYTFDEKGAFLASGRALLDVTALAPGDDSPFVVSVPVSDTVARYRIGFRGQDGRVLAHVDRRQQGPIAANW